MRPKIRQWFEAWFFRTDHWIGHDQMASHRLERIAEKVYRAGFECGRHFERCAQGIDTRKVATAYAKTTKP